MLVLTSSGNFFIYLLRRASLHFARTWVYDRNSACTCTGKVDSRFQHKHLLSRIKKNSSAGESPAIPPEHHDFVLGTTRPARRRLHKLVVISPLKALHNELLILWFGAVPFTPGQAFVEMITLFQREKPICPMRSKGSYE